MQNKIENRMYKVGRLNEQDIFCNLYLYLQDGESWDFQLQDGTIVMDVVDRWVEFVLEGFEQVVDINIDNMIQECRDENGKYFWILR